ncbi:MAG: hypothetical protein FJX55_16335 [Alphaproteobacteria bacterium]|nr:hypothetical protein [Alphaproteobacteria bacterium]
MVTRQRGLSKDGLIARMKEVAARTGKPRVTRAQFWHETGIPNSQIARHFESFAALVRASGLPDQYERKRIPDERLLRSMRDAFLAEGGIVTQARFERIAVHAANTYALRWGGWRRAIAALRDWLERHEPGFPLLGELRAYCDRRVRLGPTDRAAAVGRRYGEPLRFRALEHEPTSESGVIYLFGMVAEDLGFIVEALAPEFPDAEAKRRVGSEWRRVRIEFERDSRSFQRHGHDPAGCDLIVCWEHNWPDCPVEVLELKSEVRKLERV